MSEHKKWWGISFEVSVETESVEFATEHIRLVHMLIYGFIYLHPICLKLNGMEEKMLNC